MKDWSSFVSFEPSEVYRPRSIEELADYVGLVAKHRPTAGGLRTLGSLHSCAPLCDGPMVVDPSGLPKTLVIDPGGQSVTISLNHTLHETLDALAFLGKSLVATGGTYHQTLAGLMSTATAPATAQVSLYEGLEWVEYVTLDKQTNTPVVREVSRGDPDFGGVVCSLGAIGVLTRARLRIIDQPFFEAIHRIVKLDSILGDIDATSAKYDFWRINWIPKTEKALLWAANRIAPDKADLNGDYEEDGAENLLGYVFKYWEKFTLGGSGPLLDPFMEVVYNLMSAFYNVGQKPVTGPLRHILPVDKRAPLKVVMAEWSFAPDSLEKVLDCCRDYFGTHGWPNIPTEIELAKTDEWWMSPWRWPGLSQVVKVNFMYLVETAATKAERALIRSHLRGMWDALLERGIAFKAHWGKLEFMDAAFVAEHHLLDRFAPLIHPLFVNDHLQQRLVVG